MTSPLLTVEGLRVSFPTRTRVVEAVRGIGFTVGREKVGLVGESGSGKSMTGRAIGVLMVASSGCNVLVPFSRPTAAPCLP